MLSRVAENLYWISRYVERVENVARLLDVGFHLELDASIPAKESTEPSPIEGVLTILACRESFERDRDVAERDREHVLRFLTFDRHNPHSILAMLWRARENARATQEMLGGESWSQVNKLYLYLCSAKAHRRFAASPPRFFDGIKRACVLFDGLVDGSLPREEVFHFLQIGRYLERVNQIGRILTEQLGDWNEASVEDQPARVIHWASLLRGCSAYEAYCRAHHERVDPRGVVEFLVLSPDFPRSMRFCVTKCRESAREITDSDDEEVRSEADRLLGRLDSRLRYIEVDEILGVGIVPFLAEVQEECDLVGDAIHSTYFYA